VYGSAPRPETPLGLYLHIPFCRKRCKFCYFRVYTDKNAAEIERYLDGLGREVEWLARQPVVTGRPLSFVYFGGGTPSFISAKHLRALAERLRAAIPWDGVDEVSFECEPGTLTRPKLETIRELGITRLSLGVENFDDAILEVNGRAHVSKEIDRVIPWVQELGFDQWNLDLIAGMVGETEETWHDTVQKTIDVAPDSVTIYQMELPFNTEFSKRLLNGKEVGVADWATKRAWHESAIERLEGAGYEVSSAYTLVRKDRPTRFVYRDSVWQGCDLLGAGVASFSHVGGVHLQNLSGWTPYLERVLAGEPPLDRAFRPSDDERLTREMILQLKLGRIRTDYFRDKFGVDIVERFGEPFRRLEQQEMLNVDAGEIRLTRRGLLRVDQLLPEFYAPEYRNARYT
jgi:oxygen-independent coproporphyrinogen-3 oxidase